MLSKILLGQIFAVFLVFARLGTVFVQMPGIVDTYVPVRVRLLFALAVSLAVATAVGDRLPGPPASALGVAVLIVGEVVVGAFLGAVLRLLMGSLEVAGTLIAQQSGLAAVNVLNPALASQGALPSALLGVLGVVAIFVTDLHHLLIRAIVDSYATFVPGAALPAGDFSELAVRLTATSFRIGVQMAAPFLVVGSACSRG